jgi:hypothetical protein
MSDTGALVPLDDDVELPERVWALRQQGLTNQQIARRLMISVPEVHAALDKVLPVLDARYRRQAISEALLILDTVTGFHMKNVADPESASIVIRSLCEKRFWTGITGSVDPVQLMHASKAAEGETSMSPFKRGLSWLQQAELLDRDGRAAPEELETKPRPDDPASDDTAE